MKKTTILRVNDDGVHNRDTKTKLLLAICGDEHFNQTWHEIWEGEGQQKTYYIAFLSKLLHGKMRIVLDVCLQWTISKFTTIQKFWN